MFKTLTIPFFVLLFVVAPAWADWVPEDGHKMHFPQLPDEDGWDVYATFDKVLADDWQCSQTGWVKDIHFWGSWKDTDTQPDGIGNVGVINSFHLSIHSNIANGPNGFSIPGPVMWDRDLDAGYINVDPPTLEGWYDPNTDTYTPDDHNAYFQYNIFLDEADWFWQDEGAIYWLDISANVATADTLWGWKTADVDQYPDPFTGSHFMDDAVWDHLLEPAGWQELTDPTGVSLDLAFVITPEPATLALLLVGGILGLARRLR